MWPFYINSYLKMLRIRLGGIALHYTSPPRIKQIKTLHFAVLFSRRSHFHFKVLSYPMNKDSMNKLSRVNKALLHVQRTWPFFSSNSLSFSFFEANLVYMIIIGFNQVGQSKKTELGQFHSLKVRQSEMCIIWKKSSSR